MPTCRLWRAITSRWSGPPLLVTLAPAPASDKLQVTSTRFWGDTIVTWLFDLHYTLLLGGTGLTLVGIVGLVNLAMLLSGL